MLEPQSAKVRKVEESLDLDPRKDDAFCGLWLHVFQHIATNHPCVHNTCIIIVGNLFDESKRGGVITYDNMVSSRRGGATPTRQK